MIARLPRLCSVLVLLLPGLAAPAYADMSGYCTLNPKTYISNSGQYKLHVDPSTLFGQGEGSYRLSRGAAEVWAKRLPFTLWDAAVADDGTVAGYAYTYGMENYSFKEGMPRDGEVYFVILDPAGAPRMVDALPRHGRFTCTSTVDRSATGIILNSENDRFVARYRDDETRSYCESWRVYKLSTGALVDEFHVDVDRPRKDCYCEILATRAVAGTPLILINWRYPALDGYECAGTAGSGYFGLIDSSGAIVWELDRPNDYPFFMLVPDECGVFERDEWHRLVRIEQRLQADGAILQTDLAHHFDLWFVQEGRRVSFEIGEDAAGGWRVTQRGVSDYAPILPDDPNEHPVHLDQLTLRMIGQVKPPDDASTAQSKQDKGAIDNGVWPWSIGEQRDYRGLLAKTSHLYDLLDNDDAVRSRTRNGRYWIVSSEQLSLISEDDKTIRNIQRRSDDDWLDKIDSAAMASDGTLAVLSHDVEEGDVRIPDEYRVSLYAANGDPQTTVRLPNVLEMYWMPDQFAFNGRYVLVGTWFRANQCLLLDCAANPPRWFGLGEIADIELGDYFDFALDGKELWLIKKDERTALRFEVPDTSTPRGADRR